MSGHDFSRAVNATKRRRALAPEGYFSWVLAWNLTFSAACSAPGKGPFDRMHPEGGPSPPTHGRMKWYTDMTNDNLEDFQPTSEATPETTAGAPGLDSQTREVPPAAESADEPSESQESFADMLSAFERSHTHKAESGKGPGQRQLQGVVVSLSADQVFLDIGYKTEGVLPRSAFDNNAEAVKPGDTFPSPSPAATKSTITSFRASKWPSRATGRPSKLHSLRKSPSSAPSLKSCKGGLTRRCRRARLHARQPQRHARRSRAGKARRHRNHLPHHQARRHR